MGFCGVCNPILRLVNHFVQRIFGDAFRSCLLESRNQFADDMLVNDRLDRHPTEFARRIAASGARVCVYGHLHRPQDWASATQGLVDGVDYQLTSCDYLGFGPVAVRGLNRLANDAH